MTEFNPFAPTDHEEPPAPESPGQEGGSRTMLAVGLAGVAALAIAAGAYFFLSGSEDSDSLDTAGPVAAAPRAAPAGPAAAAEPATKLPPPAKLALGRNPFRALYVAPAPVPEADPAAPATDPLANTPAGAPTVVVVDGGTAPGSGTGTGASAPQQPTAKEHKLVLLRVFGEGKDQSASFSIDGKQQTAKVGTTFGPSAEILLLSLQQGPKDDQWTAVLQVGDGDPFDVVTGEPVFVR